MSSIEDKISLPLILIMKAHSSLGDELIILAGASDKRVAEKAQSLKKLLKNYKTSEISNIIWGSSVIKSTLIQPIIIHKFAEAEQGQIPPHNNNDYKEIFIGYMKSPLIQEIDKKRQKCYPTVWFDRQLVFKFNCGDFEPGDSGASVADKKGRALGILHAAWVTENFRYAIASPYFAVFEALDVVEIME
ncbi:hypothetical protein RhiirA4_505588 [Rhizophagus irregularis]|uniref:Uncharacterized protein n=1 Tax=Rhizophagus irregularis TaxID=588596 RepID=A0A2I1FSN4_9GLOM|nr:hypothetical protein RhiirA4_505588 [Rhizophagus irregularis]